MFDRDEIGRLIREGAVLVAFTAPDPGGVQFVGQVKGYYDQPVFMIETEAGNESTWAASLTREATPAEAVEYWMRRALKAERTDGSPF